MENNFISCQAKYGKLYDNFSTHFKVATNMKMRCFKKKKNAFWKIIHFLENVNVKTNGNEKFFSNLSI